MRKIQLTESELINVIKRIINEQQSDNNTILKDEKDIKDMLLKFNFKPEGKDEYSKGNTKVKILSKDSPLEEVLSVTFGTFVEKGKPYTNIKGFKIDYSGDDRTYVDGNVEWILTTKPIFDYIKNIK